MKQLSTRTTLVYYAQLVLGILAMWFGWPRMQGVFGGLLAAVPGLLLMSTAIYGLRSSRPTAQLPFGIRLAMGIAACCIIGWALLFAFYVVAFRTFTF